MKIIITFTTLPKIGTVERRPTHRNKNQLNLKRLNGIVLKVC